jgi:hypothetical protein
MECLLLILLWYNAANFVFLYGVLKTTPCPYLRYRMQKAQIFVLATGLAECMHADHFIKCITAPKLVAYAWTFGESGLGRKGKGDRPAMPSINSKQTRWRWSISRRCCRDLQSSDKPGTNATNTTNRTRINNQWCP